MTVTPVKAHTRGKPDPFAPVLEAKRPHFASKWGVEMVSANDERLAAPIADPVPGPGRQSRAEISAQLEALAAQADKIASSL
jgi:hypothetical protein